MRNINDSLQKLKQIIDEIRVTDQQGKTIPIDTALEQTIQSILEHAQEGGKVFFIGNGGSAAIASHMAVDFWKNGGIPALAFNDASLLTCLSNDCGYEHVFEKSIEMFAGAKDILVAISSSGQSENILRGVTTAQNKGVEVLTLSGFKDDNSLRSMGKVNFYVPASDYGYVEIIHHFLCHFMVDVIISEKSECLEKVQP